MYRRKLLSVCLLFGFALALAPDAVDVSAQDAARRTTQEKLERKRSADQRKASSENRKNRQKQNQAKQSRGEKEDGVWECTVTAQCRTATGVIIGFEWFTGAHENKAIALQDAVNQCREWDGCADWEDETTGPLTKFCCESEIAVPPCDPVECLFMPRVKRRSPPRVKGDGPKECRYSAIAVDNLPVFGPSAECSVAWKNFARIAKARGGIIPGTLRVITPYRYFCYVRIGRRENDTIEDFEVEASSDSPADASAKAKSAAYSTKELLPGARILPGIRCVRVRVDNLGCAPASKVCRHECRTVHGDKKVIVTRFGWSRECACAAAEAVAVVLADYYGGIEPGSCRNKHLTGVALAGRRAVNQHTAGCCGSASLKNAAAAVPTPAPVPESPDETP